MKVVTYEAHNVMGVKDVRFDMAGHHLFLVGGDNEQGKSSALNALLMALCGRSAMDWPDVALRDGEDEGWVKVELAGEDAGFTLELLMKRKGRTGQVVEQFRLIAADGKAVSEPRALLKSLFHFRGFDPTEFSRLPRAEKRKTLMKLVGLDFADDEAKAKELYDQRRDLNRDLKTAAAELGATRFYQDAPEEEVSTPDLLKELEDRQRYNAETEKLRKSEGERLAVAEGYKRAIEQCHDQIRVFQEQIERAKANIVHHTENGHAAKLEADAITRQLASREERDTEEIRQQIKSAGDTNVKVQANQKRRAAIAKESALRKQVEDLTAAMDGITTAQQKRLESAKWPVAGLGIDAEGVLLNGLPFEQASASQRMLVSTKIGMALNPTLRLLVCQDGGDLGNGTLDALSKLLEEEKFQMVLELVTRSDSDEDRCAVVIQGGAVKKKR